MPRCAPSVHEQLLVTGGTVTQSSSSQPCSQSLWRLSECIDTTDATSACSTATATVPATGPRLLVLALLLGGLMTQVGR